MLATENEEKWPIPFDNFFTPSRRINLTKSTLISKQKPYTQKSIHIFPDSLIVTDSEWTY